MFFMRSFPALLLFAVSALADWHVMPMPSSIQAGSGGLAITPAFRIELAGYKEARLEAAAARMTGRIAQLTGFLWFRQPRR